MVNILTGVVASQLDTNWPETLEGLVMVTCVSITHCLATQLGCRIMILIECPDYFYKCVGCIVLYSYVIKCISRIK